MCTRNLEQVGLRLLHAHRRVPRKRAKFFALHTEMVYQRLLLTATHAQGIALGDSPKPQFGDFDSPLPRSVPRLCLGIDPCSTSMTTLVPVHFVINHWHFLR